MNPYFLPFKYLIFALIALSIWISVAHGLEDLFLRNKSDSTIKMLVFPLSMAVVENRPLHSLYYFYEYKVEEKNEKSISESDSTESPLYEIFSNSGIIKKTLVKSDPTRVAPSKQHDDILGPVTKTELKKLSSKYKKDMILVFRREIFIQSETNLSDSLQKNPEELINPKEAITIKIKSTALIYLAKQNKVLMIRPNDQSKTITPGDTAKTDLHDLAQSGLQQLAKQTKKVIRDNQFTVRRSNY
ncbi:MAG: hypothetical protein ACQ9MH_10915 [Nitrospinales bacterium]